MRLRSGGREQRNQDDDEDAKPNHLGFSFAAVTVTVTVTAVIDSEFDECGSSKQRAEHV